ncbi:flavin reductase family protein [Puia dinghuensis]|uniref:Putative oxidoreductase n=1 Tax=Puia dinghuensis TaxID=1792502 RepID=A0A8J2UHL9_9BACT|nr:iron-sulfur cluster-binding domain-containing protein [Puia dinghuensis]GGB19378.1 putative oxidoreductase [Puia dinghuensis]
MTTIALQVVDIRAEAKDMVTIVLRRQDGRPLEYQAGQFLTFLFSFRGRELRRSYSFSSTPGVDHLPAVTVKRIVNGEVSRYLIDHLKVGDVLTSLPPAGKFLLEEVSGGTLVFVAAGSGMVPVFSLMKEALRRAAVSFGGVTSAAVKRIVLISQNRNEESVPFRGELAALGREYAGAFEWVSLLSSRGVRLSNGLLRDLLGELRLGGGLGSALFYLCGPPAFMRMVTFTLRPMGVAAGQIKKENFTVEYVPPAPLLVDKGTKRVVVHSAGQRYEFDTAWPSTILDSALARHIALPYSCRGGRCSTCVARCVSGSVKMSINEVLTEKDLQAGLVLPCVGYAETDVELEL